MGIGDWRLGNINKAINYCQYDNEKYFFCSNISLIDSKFNLYEIEHVNNSKDFRKC